MSQQHALSVDKANTHCVILARRPPADWRKPLVPSTWSWQTHIWNTWPVLFFIFAPDQDWCLKPKKILYGAANMVRSLAHRIYKIMLRELKLFSLVKRWLRRDIAQILTPQRAVMKMLSFSNSNITNICHHKLQPVSLRLNIMKMYFSTRGGQCGSVILSDYSSFTLGGCQDTSWTCLVFIKLYSEAGLQEFQRSLLSIFLCPCNQKFHWKYLCPFTTTEEI